MHEHTHLTTQFSVGQRSVDDGHFAKGDDNGRLSVELHGLEVVKVRDYSHSELSVHAVAHVSESRGAHVLWRLRARNLQYLHSKTSMSTDFVTRCTSWASPIRRTLSSERCKRTRICTRAPFVGTAWKRNTVHPRLPHQYRFCMLLCHTALHSALTPTRVNNSPTTAVAR